MEEKMTGNKHNPEGHSGDDGQGDPGPYWRRMHRDWRFWIGALFMAVALAVLVFSFNLAWVPWGRSQ
jgi:hypothetical protein